MAGGKGAADIDGGGHMTSDGPQHRAAQEPADAASDVVRGAASVPDHAREHPPGADSPPPFSPPFSPSTRPASGGPGWGPPPVSDGQRDDDRDRSFAPPVPQQP